jgi:hypothetical protein
MFEAQIAKGVAYLDRDLGLSWPERIDLSELDLSDGHYCVVGQCYGHFSNHFHPGDGIPCGFELHLCDDSRKYEQLTQEWKEKISQLTAERQPVL